MPKLETKPLGFFKEQPQARQHYDEGELRLLGESLRKRQLQPVLAKPDGTIIAGHRRFRAATLAGLSSLMVIITEEQLTESEFRGIQLTENIHRADLTGYEKWLACKELGELNPGWSGKDLADHLHLSAASVTQMSSPSKCIPEVVEALKVGRITLSDCYDISKNPLADQPVLFELRLNGANREKLRQAGRKQRAASTPSVRASKIKCPLPSGQVVTVAGDGISLEEAVDLLAEVIKQMKKAIGQGLDARTFQAVLKDVAAAG